MSARDLALAAWAEEVEASGQRARAEEQRQREERERQYAHARELIELSPLSEWFPGVEWAIMDFLGDTIVVAPEPERDFRLGISERSRRSHAGRTTRVSVGRIASDTDTGYRYWSGQAVKSLAGVGAHLKNLSAEHTL